MEALAVREFELPTEQSATTDGRVYFKTILGLALASRLGVVWMALSGYLPVRLFDEAPDLAFLAQSLSSGRGFSSPFGGSTGPSALVTPGYPAIVALIFRLFGSYSMASASVVMLLQTLFAVLTVAVIMWVARRLFGDRTANLAGVLWAESVPLLWMPILFWETSLSILLLTGMVALALRCVEKSSASLWAVIGVYCGLAMLVNPALLLAMLAVCCWAAYRTRSSSLYGPLMGLFVMLVVFAPWPIRNARVMHAFIPLRSSFGYELWQGNRAGADGVFDGSLYPANSKLEFADYASKGELAYMREKSALAKAYIRAHPSEFIWLTAKRAARFWMGRDGKIDSIPMELYMATISLLGLLGLVTLFIKHRSTSMLFLLPLLVFPLPYYITDMKFRYRLTIDPLLTILVAYAVIQLSAYVNKKRMTIV